MNAVFYWILVLLLAVFWGVGQATPADTKWPGWGAGIVWILLLVLIGLALFGSPLKG